MHDFIVGLALRVEVGAALAAAHGKGGQTVLQDLLEAQELQHAKGNGRVEAQAALVGADGAVELNAIATVDLNFAVVIDPRHAELDDALGLDDALKNRSFLVLGMSIDDRLQGGQNLGCSLDEQRLIRVLLLHVLKDALYVRHAFSFYRSILGAAHTTLIKPSP